MTVICECIRIREWFRKKRVAQDVRKYFSRFTQTYEPVTEKQREMLSWPAHRRKASASQRPVKRNDPEVREDVREMLDETDETAGRALRGIHTIPHVRRYGSRQAEFELAARRVTRKLGKPISRRVVERVWKRWESHQARKSLI